MVLGPDLSAFAGAGRLPAPVAAPRDVHLSSEWSLGPGWRQPPSEVRPAGHIGFL